MKNEELQEIQKGFYSKIVDRAKKLGLEKEEKQILPMSILFTADYLTEKYLFKDGILLDFEKCVDLLKNKGEVSENERAYQFIIDEIQMNGSRFSRKSDEFTANECWGLIEEGSNVAIINGNAFRKILERGNFSEKSFFSWAARNKIIETDSNGNYKKNKRIGNTVARCVFLKINSENVQEQLDLENPFT